MDSDRICLRCRFYAKDVSPAPYIDSAGQCRKNPPAGATVMGGDTVYPHWPRVNALDWCGAFEAEANVGSPGIENAGRVIGGPADGGPSITCLACGFTRPVPRCTTHDELSALMKTPCPHCPPIAES